MGAVPTVDQAYVQQYADNIYVLSQQKGSILAPFVRKVTQKAESKFWDRIGAIDPHKRTSRHEDTHLINPPHSRRMATLVDYDANMLVDDIDQIRTLNDPTNAYAQASMWAMGRGKDDEIIEAALGNAYSGKKGTTAVPLPATQKLVAHDGTSLVGVDLNVRTLRKLKRYFDRKEVDKSLTRYLVVSSSQIENLLGETEVGSRDYNIVAALVDGEIKKFMGFIILGSERLGTLAVALTYNKDNGSTGAGTGTLAVGARECFAWAGDGDDSGLLLTTAKEVTTDVGPRRDKNNAMQVSAVMGIGATRMEEEKVVGVYCKEA